MCFNPRTHTGCDVTERHNQPILDVSIHAPTRGATNLVCQVRDSLLVSIHAPTRGATNESLCQIQTGRFQSTHPHGVRHNEKMNINLAPGFNPRTHTGCDSTCPRGFTQSSTFQSTHPHGVRLHQHLLCHRLPLCFNPRTHTGCDAAEKAYTQGFAGFNPRTHTGCDWRQHQRRERQGRFQSTHPHGVRPSHWCRRRSLLCFNPRTHTGCDQNE